MISDECLEKLRKEYPKGTLIRLVHMNDDIHPVPDGMLGIVDYIDDAGTIHIKWSNGSSLGLIIGVDTFTKV